jgi:hypothetical protein
LEGSVLWQHQLQPIFYATLKVSKTLHLLHYLEKPEVMVLGQYEVKQLRLEVAISVGLAVEQVVELTAGWAFELAIEPNAGLVASLTAAVARVA